MVYLDITLTSKIIILLFISVECKFLGVLVLFYVHDHIQAATQQVVCVCIFTVHSCGALYKANASLGPSESWLEALEDSLTF